MGRQDLLLGYDPEFFFMASTGTMGGKAKAGGLGCVSTFFASSLCFARCVTLCVSMISLQMISRRCQMLFFHATAMERNVAENKHNNDI